MSRFRLLGAARPISTPSPDGAWLGITSQGFPDFEQFAPPGFPDGRQVNTKGVLYH
jgi:hypothetical protein